LTEPSSSGPGAPGDGKGASQIDIEYANTNRNLSTGLGGTAVAILIFLLFFFYNGTLAGEFDPLLFRLSVSTVTISLFLMTYAAIYYYRVVLSERKKDMKAKYHIQRADTLFFFGIVFLLLEPPLILLTIKLYDVAALALALWLGSMVLEFLVWRDLRAT